MESDFWNRLDTKLFSLLEAVQSAAILQYVPSGNDLFVYKPQVSPDTDISKYAMYFTLKVLNMRECCIRHNKFAATGIKS